MMGQEEQTGAVHETAEIHGSAIVDAGAHIGAGTRVWHFCHVMAGARIGAGCVLGQNVYVGGRAVLGDRCRIANNVSIYDAVCLEDDVFVGPSAVFTNVRTPRAFISRQDDYRPTRVGRGATIGANATIVCGQTLGDYCLVAAGAVVTRDVSAYGLAMGVPARAAGWVCRCGETLSTDDALPPSGARLTCRTCGKTFAVQGLTPTGGVTGIRPLE